MTNADRTATDPWEALAAELELWAAAGKIAEFWWRDDDAAEPSPALDALLKVAVDAEVSVALAVIPQPATESLAARLADSAGADVLQHGYAHLNHAPVGEKKIELGPHRPAEHVVAELAMGRDRLGALFGDRLLPVLVPPWNRIAPMLVPMLAEMHYAGLSTFGPRQRAAPVRALIQINAHVDVIDWRGNRGFVGVGRALADTVAHLAARRTGEAEAAEPTGLLTHHLVQSGDSWAFLGNLFAMLSAHPAAQILSARAMFGHPGAAP